jgi:hypothetical protein
MQQNNIISTHHMTTCITFVRFIQHDRGERLTGYGYIQHTTARDPTHESSPPHHTAFIHEFNHDHLMIAHHGYSLYLLGTMKMGGVFESPYSSWRSYLSTVGRRPARARQAVSISVSTTRKSSAEMQNIRHYCV